MGQVPTFLPFSSPAVLCCWGRQGQSRAGQGTQQALPTSSFPMKDSPVVGSVLGYQVFLTTLGITYCCSLGWGLGQESQRG